MLNPIVIAYHLIWTAYGWWLPNDPRGSMSNMIRNETISGLGEIHFGRKKVQPASREIREFYEEAKPFLKYPLVTFRPADFSMIAQAFAEEITAQKYTCYACSIMPDHVHILIRKHKHAAEVMIANLQQSSRRLLRDQNIRDTDHPTWGGPGWKVFLDTPDDIRRTIEYVENNPLKARLPVQKWSFVKEYDGWPLHPGHDPRSPYAMRLREANDERERLL